MWRQFPYAYVCSTGMSLKIRGHHFKTLGGYHFRYPNVMLDKCPKMEIFGHQPYFPITQNLVINECHHEFFEKYLNFDIFPNLKNLYLNLNGTKQKIMYEHEKCISHELLTNSQFDNIVYKLMNNKYTLDIIGCSDVTPEITLCIFNDKWYSLSPIDERNQLN